MGKKEQVPARAVHVLSLYTLNLRTETMQLLCSV